MGETERERERGTGRNPATPFIAALSLAGGVLPTWRRPFPLAAPCFFFLADPLSLPPNPLAGHRLEHLQARYVGTGHPDLHRYDWLSNIQRDTYASLVGHHNMLQYVALCENESVGRTKYKLLNKMFLPCGNPPERED